ncbi:MAG: AraC family transcriptional regulator [Pedobacter sp.]
MEILLVSSKKLRNQVKRGVMPFDCHSVLIIPSTIKREISAWESISKVVTISDYELQQYLSTFPRHALESIYLKNKEVSIKLSSAQHQNLLSAMQNNNLSHLLLLVNHYYGLRNPQLDSLRCHIVKQLNKLIDKYYSSQPNIRFYANILGISPTKLNQITLTENGKVTKDIINQKRIIKAIDELANDQTTIKEISNKLGFQSIAHFSVWFKRHRNHSPLQYRRIVKCKL